jgi:hypothetical protein
MKHREVVIYARTYDQENCEGKLVRGGEIHILSKKQTISDENGVSNGHKVAQLEVPFEVAQRIIGQVPAVCEVDYEITAENKAIVLLPKNVHVIKEIESLNIEEEIERLAEDSIRPF